MSSQNTISVAVVGTGLIGPRHAQAVLSNPSTTLSCIVDPNPAAAKVASELGVNLYPSIQAMVSSDDKPAAAIVCTPNHKHVAVSTELLNAGIHVLCEKPLSIDIANGAELVRRAEQLNLHLLTGHHRRFNPFVTAAQRIIESGRLGRVIAVSGLWTLFKPPTYFDPPTEWRRSAGAVWINLIHDLDVLQYLFGSIERVTAEETAKTRGFEADEGAAVLLKFESGAVGTFICCDAVVSAHGFEMGTGENPLIPRTGRDFYRIFGTDASLSVPDLRMTSYAVPVEKSWSSPLTEETIALDTLLSKAEMKAPFDLQVENLVTVLRGQGKARCTGADGLSAVKVAVAIRKALQAKGLDRTVQVRSVL
ncbi:quinate utilization oxidoreductase QutH [Phyllosticta capitalensis]|uniref:Quinate utilization oxidoreductase QutH n=1 Tax=Phyllosticta capitalensis TaxID=121624 RepID=A0ABR1YTW4_9PEZI